MSKHRRCSIIVEIMVNTFLLSRSAGIYNLLPLVWHGYSIKFHKLEVIQRPGIRQTSFMDSR